MTAYQPSKQTLAILALLALCTGRPLAWAADPDLAGAQPAPRVLLTSPPAGHCTFDPQAAGNAGLATGFKPGVKDASELVALYVPCDQLERAKAGHVAWLPEWVAIEKNAVTMPSDDERNGKGTSRQAVDTLCRDAQARHWQIDAETFEAKTAAAHKSLSAERPVVYFGVVSNDPQACFMASLTLESDPLGGRHRMLNIFAFMAIGNTWIYHTTRRLAEDASQAQEILYLAKTDARLFLKRNE